MLARKDLDLGGVLIHPGEEARLVAEQPVVPSQDVCADRLEQRMERRPRARVEDRGGQVEGVLVSHGRAPILLGARLHLDLKMNDHQSDTRVIEADHPSYNATLIRRIDETHDLGYFWVRFDEEATPFEPGQYMTIGVYVDGKIVQRPYSVASAPRDANGTGYEFYVKLVPIMRFTTLLWRLPVGHRMRMIGPKGKFKLEPDDDRTHLFISTGTGIAPFIAMMRESLADGAPRRTVLLHGCSYADELGYADLLRGWEADGTYPVRYVPTVSRATAERNASWTGRTGRVETIVESVQQEFDLRPERTVVYICGNPEMILNAERILVESGFPEFHVKKELYWPKGKSAVAAGETSA